MGSLERREGYWLWRGGPVPPGAAGITIGRLVSVRSARPTAHLLRHEEGHVVQWRQLGPVRFLVRYLSAYLRERLSGRSHWAAYRRIPLEIEAEWSARHGGVPGTDPPR